MKNVNFKLTLQAKPLVWEKDGKDVWIAYTGTEGPFQIDKMSKKGEPLLYSAQLNCEFDSMQEDFTTLKDAKQYCQECQNKTIACIIENYVDVSVSV